MAALDRVKAAFSALVGAANPRAEYHGIFAGKVVSQGGDTVDVQLDDERMPGMSSLPVTVGLPGSQVSFAAGCRMFIFFENGDPAKPRAIGWDAATGGTVLNLTLGGRSAVDALIKGTSYRAAEDILFAACSAGFKALAAASGPGSPTSALAPSFAAIAAALDLFRSTATSAEGFLSKVTKTI